MFKKCPWLHIFTYILFVQFWEIAPGGLTWGLCLHVGIRSVYQGKQEDACQELRNFGAERMKKQYVMRRGCCCSVAKSCPTLCDPMDSSTPGFPVLHCLLEFAKTHVHWVSDAIQPSHPVSPSPPDLNLSQHQPWNELAPPGKPIKSGKNPVRENQSYHSHLALPCVFAFSILFSRLCAGSKTWEGSGLLSVPVGHSCGQLPAWQGGKISPVFKFLAWLNFTSLLPDSSVFTFLFLEHLF